MACNALSWIQRLRAGPTTFRVSNLTGSSVSQFALPLARRPIQPNAEALQPHALVRLVQHLDGLPNYRPRPTGPYLMHRSPWVDAELLMLQQHPFLYGGTCNYALSGNIAKSVVMIIMIIQQANLANTNVTDIAGKPFSLSGGPSTK
jgi:hypothetical protein